MILNFYNIVCIKIADELVHSKYFDRFKSEDSNTNCKYSLEIKITPCFEYKNLVFVSNYMAYNDEKK